MRPVKRSDKQNRKLLQGLFRRRGIVNSQEDYLVDDLGRPIVNLLPEAEVGGTPTQYEEADLAGSVLRGGALAGREALGLVPVVGEALDLAELNQIARTGKDFYGDEADPTMYAGMTAAGMLLPNIIERPARAIGRGVKKFFKFGKKADPIVDDIPREPILKRGDVTSLPIKDASGNLVDRHPLKVRTPAPEDAKGLPTISWQEGTKFVRDWYSDPRVQDHFRNIVGSKYTGADRKIFMDAYDEYSDLHQSLVGTWKEPDFDLPGAPEVWRAKDPQMQEILNEISVIERNTPGFDDLDFLETDPISIMSESDGQRYKELWDNLYSRQGELSQQIALDLEKKHGKDVIDELRRGGDSIYQLDVNKIEEPGANLERVFVKGRTTPDVLADFKPKDMRRVVPEDAGGVSNSRVTAVVALDEEGMETINSSAWRKEWEQSSLAHEANHDATADFIRSTSPEAKKIRDGLSLAVKPEFRKLVKSGAYVGDIESDSYYASAAELTARAMEMRRNLINTVKNYRSYRAGSQHETLSEDALLRGRQISAAFGGSLPSEEQVFKFVTGNHEGFTDAQKQALVGASLGNKSGVWDLYERVLDGAPGSDEKLEGVRNLMKFGLVATGAAGAYGALDNQGGQPPNSMALGGVIDLPKNEGGMKPIRRKDRQNRDILKSLFRRKDNAALVDPKEDYMTDDSGKPILNLLPEAEVLGTPTEYKEADLAKAGLLALREAGGMVPGLDYALDAAELENISRTGKDFYGDETTPESYAAMIGAGVLLPGVLKRAGRGFGKAAKKFFNLSETKDVKEKAFQALKTAHAKSELVRDATDLVANRGLGYKKFVLEEGNRIVKEMNTPEGRKRIAEQIKLERSKAGKEPFTDWEMEQVVDYKISQVQGAVDNSFNVRSTMNLPLRNASFMKFGGDWSPPLSGPMAKTAQNASATTTGNFEYAYPYWISPEEKQKWNTLYKKMGTGESLSGLGDGRSGSATLGVGAKYRDVLEHELFHAFQDRAGTPLDKEIQDVMLDIRKKASGGSRKIEDRWSGLDERGKRTAEYMTDFFDTREPGAHLMELRDQLRQLGIISNRYDEITPDMLEKAYEMTKNNSSSSLITGAAKPRVIHMIGDKSLRSDFFKQIAPLMNKLPAVAAVGAGVGLATGESSEDYSKGGVMAMRKKKKGMSTIRK